jgi:hypothetical protein
VSLKVFHVVFIILSILLAAGCAAWAFMNDVSEAFAWACAVVAVLLAVYGVFFIRKARKIIV